MTEAVFRNGGMSDLLNIMYSENFTFILEMTVSYLSTVQESKLGCGLPIVPSFKESENVIQMSLASTYSFSFIHCFMNNNSKAKPRKQCVEFIIPTMPWGCL